MVANAGKRAWDTSLSTSLMAVGALVIAVLLVRLQTRPLSTFVKAAERIAHVRAAWPPWRRRAPGGPCAGDGVQRYAAAHHALIDDRTHALAAVSHDLKTPITRLRFRTEEMGDAALRAAVASDLDEMERMIDQTLSYLKEERGDEDMKPVDLVATSKTVYG